jgi:hypothetical protein
MLTQPDVAQEVNSIIISYNNKNNKTALKPNKNIKQAVYSFLTKVYYPLLQTLGTNQPINSPVSILKAIKELNDEEYKKLLEQVSKKESEFVNDGAINRIKIEHITTKDQRSIFYHTLRNIITQQRTAEKTQNQKILPKLSATKLPSNSARQTTKEVITQQLLEDITSSREPTIYSQDGSMQSDIADNTEDLEKILTEKIKQHRDILSSNFDTTDIPSLQHVNLLWLNVNTITQHIAKFPLRLTMSHNDKQTKDIYTKHYKQLLDMSHPQSKNALSQLVQASVNIMNATIDLQIETLYKQLESDKKNKQKPDAKGIKAIFDQHIPRRLFSPLQRRQYDKDIESIQHELHNNTIFSKDKRSSAVLH